MTEQNLVVWWRGRPTVRVPRSHEIGWCSTSGSPHGRLVITSPHLRLDRRQIEAALVAELASRYPTPPTLAPAQQMLDQLSKEAALRVAGHTIVEADLVGEYGLDVVADLTATLLGQGIDAAISLEVGLGPAVRAATLRTVATALDDFATASPVDLYEAGWERISPDRWQLLLIQR